jgi:hypothetical protein
MVPQNIAKIAKRSVANLIILQYAELGRTRLAGAWNKEGACLIRLGTSSNANKNVSSILGEKKSELGCESDDDS